jgi:hypothetical protein
VTRTPVTTESARPADPGIRRRGLLACAWAAVAGLVLKYTASPVEAATANVVYETTGPGSLPNNVGSTLLIQPGATLPASGPVLQVQNVSSNPTTLIQAVIGTVNGPGTAVNANAGTGVGVFGSSFKGTGVRGEIFSFDNTTHTFAVYGANNSSYTGASPGAGGFGVYGLSAKGHGLVGATAAAGAAAVVGATNGVAGAYAGAFYGPVIIGGDLTVVGGAKSAAVPHPDGTHRRLYCLESPESWFEDFGKASLECGRAHIRLDPDFTAVARTDDYHVFLTPYGGRDLLTVAEQTPDGFSVEGEPLGTTRFSWRVVARRKDIPGVRLEPVEVPPEPVLPQIPAPAAARPL